MPRWVRSTEDREQRLVAHPTHSCQTLGMAQVDPEDDSVIRYVVFRYAFDPARCERRHRVIAAFDSEPEYRDQIERLSGALRARDDRDPREHISGTVWE